MPSAELIELERRVDLAIKGMNLLLFGEPEVVSGREGRELRKRLRDYLRDKDSEFVELKDLKGARTQEGS